MDGLPDFWVLRPNAAPHKKGRFFCHCSINRARWKGLKTAGRRFFCKRCPAAFAPFCFWGFFFSGGKGCNFFYCLFCGLAFFIPFTFLLNFKFFLRRAQAARGPLLSAPAESRQRQAQGSFTPLRIPGPKWGAGRPPLETPKSSLARQRGYKIEEWPNSSPLARLELRCRWGRPRAPARSPRPPHLHRFGFGGFAPLPPRSPLGDVCRSCAFEGFAPLPPKVPHWGKPADHARQRMGPRPKRLLRQRLRKSARKLLPRKRLGVPSLSSRGCGEATLARPPAGESQRGRSPLWPVFAHFLLARKWGPGAA